MDYAEELGVRTTRQGKLGGVLATLLIHGVLALAIYLSHIRPEAPTEEVRDLIVTRMVVLGKPREKFWLPRIVNAPRPKIAQPSIKVADNPEAPPTPKEAPKPEDAEISKDLKSALERAKRLSALAVPEEEPEGSLTGSAAGTASEAGEGDAYATQIWMAIRGNWNVATLLQDEALSKLKATVKIRVDADGTILEPTMAKPSGNDIFDDSCLAAVKATGKVPPPPAIEAAKYKRGVGLLFDPTKGG